MGDQNQPRQLTPEQQEELESRVKRFNEELMPLLKKYELGLGAVAFLLPDGRIGARAQLVDDKNYDDNANQAAPVADNTLPAPTSGTIEASE